VQAYAPELNKRCRAHLKPTHKSYRIDETYIKVKGEDRYLYRVLALPGRRSSFCLPPNAIPPQPNASCAGQLMDRAIRCHG
jgi:transposase-like protein